MDKQREILSPLTKIENWVLRNLTGVLALLPDEGETEEVTSDIDLGDVTDYLMSKLSYITNTDNTPMAEFMPFAPYLECYKTFLGQCTSGAPQPVSTDFVVPTVIGSNKKDSNTFAMTPSLTFLIPTVLNLVLETEPELADSNDPEAWAMAMAKVFADDAMRGKLESEVNGLLASPEKLEAIASEDNAGLSLSAYEAVNQLLFGLSNLKTNSELLGLTDYYRNDETDLAVLSPTWGSLEPSLTICCLPVLHTRRCATALSKQPCIALTIRLGLTFGLTTLKVKSAIWMWATC